MFTSLKKKKKTGKGAGYTCGQSKTGLCYEIQTILVILQEYYGYMICLLCVSVFACVRYWRPCSVVLQPSKAKYFIYCGRRLTHIGLYHNIYIRLIKKQTSEWVVIFKSN